MIYIADLHLREDVPACRAETEQEWLEHQAHRLNCIVDYANRKRCNILIAGDIFHRAKPPVHIVNLFLSAMAQVDCEVFIMPGNHDLHYRDATMEKTAYEILHNLAKSGANRLRQIHDIFNSVPYGTEDILGNDLTMLETRPIALHVLTFRTEADVPYGCKNYETAKSLCVKYPKHNLIIVGDMHKPFTYSNGEQRVINCGSMTVQSINEAEYDHGFWYNEEFIKFDDSVQLLQIDREGERQRDERIDAFVEQLAKQEGISIDYLENLQNALTAQKDSAIISIVEGWMQ